MRFPPLDVVETWPKPNYIDPDRRGHASLIVQCMLVFLATVIVSIRLYARVAITKARVGIDDVIIIISLIFAIGLSGSVILAIRQYGWDVHIWDLPPKDTITSRKISWVAMLLYTTTVCLTKASILIFYQRIIVSKFDKIVTKCTLVFVIVYYAATFLVLFLQCRPFQHYWEILIPAAAGTCVDESIHLITTATLNLLLDIVVFLIPLRSLIALKIRATQKIHLISLFSAGLIVIAAAAVRLAYTIIVTLHTYDVPWYGYITWLWASVEVHVSIICACVPSCRAFFVAWSKTFSKGGSNIATSPSGAVKSYKNDIEGEADSVRLTGKTMGMDRCIGVDTVVLAQSRPRVVTSGITIETKVFQYEHYTSPRLPSLPKIEGCGSSGRPN
ncbi:hypothetical protein VE03_10404 [Pseudogymnoascus sp. 23342-1-I1]|nr:hypothetical protein VE03_10404 [Pseudogymnoascus sp. 23342-1-I1]